MAVRTSSTDQARRRRERASAAVGSPRYKWVVLSNTTLGVLMATINMSIMLIALPDIFRGLGIDPLQPGNTSLLLWLIMGYMMVTAVLVVSFGRLGDMVGRVRMYNAGFAVFTVFSFVGRCHGEWGSAKNTLVPVSSVNWVCPESSLPRSQLSVLRSCSGSFVIVAVSAAFIATAP